MAHAFDTGLARAQRTLIVDGAVTLLSGLLASNGGYLSQVIPFGQVVRTYTDVDGIAELLNALGGGVPSIAIATGDRAWSPAGMGGFGHKADLELLVYFASNQMHDHAIGRTEIDPVGLADDSLDPGLHVMMEHATELLIGQRCGASNTIKQIRPDREEELATRPDVTIWLQTYKLTVTTTESEWRTVTQILESIRTRTTQEDGEVKLPSAPTKGTTLDVNHDDLT